MSKSSNRTVFENFMEEGWCKANIEGVMKLLAPDHTVGGSYYASAFSMEDIRAFIEAIHALVNEINYEITHYIEEGDWLSARVLLIISPQGEGQDFNVEFQNFTRVQDGKIVESHSTVDYLRLFEGVGSLPSDVLSICMTGQKLS